jgi:hypothetical protein
MSQYQDCESKKGKAIPVISHGGPKDCKTVRLPHFLDHSLTDGSEVVSVLYLRNLGKA